MPQHDIEIFRTGEFTALSGETLAFGAEPLAAAADGYDPNLHEAPVVIGHPATDAPAYGWVTGLRMEGDRVIATVDRIDEQFADLVRSGKYRKRSAAWYTPDAPNNPTPGRYYLRHVGFLGAQPPAVKGLADVRFGDDEAGVETVELSEPPAVAPSPPAPLPPGERGDSHPPSETIDMADTPPNPELEARQAALDARERELAEREQALQAAETRRQRAELAAFAEQLVEQGRLLPRQKNRVAELLFAAPDESDHALAFAEGDQQIQATPRTLLREFLAELPVQVDFAERSAPEPAAETAAADYRVPQGYQVDPARAKLHREALAYAEQHGVEYIEAAAIVERRQAH